MPPVPLRIVPLLLVACTAPTLPAPELDSVRPTFAYNGAERVISIHGSNFFPQLDVSAVGTEVDLDLSFQAWLVGPDGDGASAAFRSVGIDTDEILSATVPAELTPGTYDVLVRSPGGQEAGLRASFTVTDTEAELLRLSSPLPAYEVSERAVVTISWLDIAQNVVPVDQEVEITVTAPAQLDGGTLRDVIPIAGGLRGLLTDGVASVTVEQSTTGLVRVDARPVDSDVPGDTLELLFQPGDDWSILYTLPQGVTTLVAGEPVQVEALLVDQHGNEVTSPASVALRTTCSGWSGQAALAGPTLVEVVPITACADDFIEAVGVAGQSDLFEVVAGDADHFELQLSDTERRAGQSLGVLVEPMDPLGNTAVWVGELSLFSSVGGLLDTVCGPSFSVWLCTTTVTAAGDPVLVRAEGNDGLRGQIDGLVVLPDVVPASVQVSVTGPVAAGVPVSVELRLLDTWGNAIDAGLIGPLVIDIDDELGEANCVSGGVGPSGAALQDCTLQTARGAAVLSVELPDFGISELSSVFQVDNGALAAVDVVATGPVVAGQTLVLTLAGADAFGNPYLVQTDPTVDVTDASGTWSTPTATLALDGTAVVGGALTRAGNTTITVSQGGVVLGSSDPFLVLAAAADALRPTLLAPWAWVGDVTDVQVEAVDIYGNRASLDLAATLSSLTNSGPDALVTLIDGVGVVPYSWSDPVFPEVLDAVGGALSGASIDLVVADTCGDIGPTVAATFDSFPEAVGCIDPVTGLAEVTADLSGSIVGSAVLDGYALSVSGASATTSTMPDVTVQLPGARGRTLHALVVDADGCGSALETVGYAGPADGTVVGPIPVSTVATELDVFDTVTLDVVGAHDCSRDAADGQDVLVRTTAGVLSGVTATGSGLAVTLDINGDGAFTLQTVGGLSESVAALHAYSPSGGAGGRVELPVVGDNILPTVVGQSPSGDIGSVVTVVELTFSEALRTDTVLPNHFSVVGPSTVAVVSAIPQLGSDRVSLFLAAAVDASLGVYTVTADGTGPLGLRDAAGNRLSGDWSGALGDYVGGFGTGGAAVDDVACISFDPAGLVLRPDGDDGVGAEADVLEIGLQSASAPAWWVLEVEHDGALVFHDRIAPASSMDIVAWDGRDLSGVVVDNGIYDLRVLPDNGLGGRGLGCDVSVVVDNRVSATPP